MGKLKTLLFMLKDNSFKKFVNFLKVRTSLAFGFSKVLGYPYNLIIEPTNFCNLNCPICPTGGGSSKRQKGYLSLENYKKIMGELKDYLLSVYLTNYGEPLLNKDLFNMISYNKVNGVKTVIATNGHFLTKSNVKKILDSGLEDITVALDGIDQKTLVKYRKNANFKTVYNGIKHLVSERNKVHSNLKIHLQFIVMKHNEDQIDNMREIVKKLGVDSLYIKTLWVKEKKHIDLYLPHNKIYRRYLIEGGNLIWKGSHKKGCSKLWTESVINWNGNVVPCCYDFYENLAMGNVFENSFMNIWNGEKYIQLRKNVLNSKYSLLICKDCPGDAELSLEEK